MNRCTSSFFSTAFSLTLLAASAAAGFAAHAQTTDFKPPVREFPIAAQRGELIVVSPPKVILNGKEERLSVGSRIRDNGNMLVMSGALVNQKLIVNYTRESAGQIHNVWILNSEEIKLKRPGMKTSWFDFGSGPAAAPDTSAKP